MTNPEGGKLVMTNLEVEKMRITTIRKLKKGEFFTLRATEEPKESQVYIREEYDRSEKKYWVSKFSDMNAGRFMSGNKTVYTDFTF